METAAVKRSAGVGRPGVLHPAVMGLGAVRRTALVTGAAGFIGSHLCDRLLGEGYEVVGIDNLMTGDLGNLAQALRDPHFHFQVHDVREQGLVYAEVIFNFASPASPVHYQADPYATFTSNVVGTLRLLELARGRQCTFVQASTSEVYGDPMVHPQPESYWGHVNPVGERSCYDEGKRAAETLLSDAQRSWGLDARILRIFNTYGPRMALGDGRVVTNFALRALERKPLIVHGEGQQTRAFCYVDDLVEGVLAAARLPRLQGPLNLGNPDEITIAQLASLVLELTGARCGIEHKPATQDDPKQRRPDITLARQLIGFEARTPLRVGLQHTIADLRERLAARAALGKG